jgi:hypothetical protein
MYDSIDHLISPSIQPNNVKRVTVSMVRVPALATHFWRQLNNGFVIPHKALMETTLTINIPAPSARARGAGVGGGGGEGEKEEKIKVRFKTSKRINH